MRFFALWLALLAAPTHGAEPIVLGDLNSYSGFAAFTEPYRQGWQLALEQINAGGGVLNRPLEVVSRDDGAKPTDAVTVAQELIHRSRAVALFGTLLSHVGLAVADVALREKIVFLAAEPLSDAIVWEKGNPYTFRLRPGTYVQAAMLAEAAAALPAQRWATIAPNYEYGQSAVAAFKQLLQARRSDVEFVAEQWPPLNKIDAGPAVQALLNANPEGIFNVTFGGDLTRFVREGTDQELFENRVVASLLSGEPEWIDPLKEEAPTGWLVTGYPWYALDTPEHTAFKTAYMERFNDYPRLGSVVGFVSLHLLAQAIEKAGTTDSDALAAALRGLEFATPFGPAVMRAIDQQSDLGAFVGTLIQEDGLPRMTQWRYAPGAEYLPDDEFVTQRRPPAP